MKHSARIRFYHIFFLALMMSMLLPPFIVHAQTSSSLLRQEWQYGVYGSGIGLSGISVFDLDGDGELEMVMGGSSTTFGPNDFWYVVKKTGPNNYEQVWISDLYQQPISRIAVADVNSDGIAEIYVGLSNGVVKVYHGLSFKEIGSFSAGSTVTDLVVADADGDGQMEVVTSDGSNIYVFSAASFTQKWASTGYGGTSIAVGNVDNDPGPEIVTTTNGGHGYVIVGITHVLKWDYINSFGRIVKLGDLDSDTKQEIIGASSWGKITIFDADLKSPTWEITTSQDIGALTVADTDGDGIPEILYGDGQWGKIHCYDAVTRLERWAINNPEHGVTAIAVADVDGDSKLEVVWGAGATSTGPDYLYIADIKTGQSKWQSMDIVGPLSAVDVGDIDGDGQDEIVMVSYESNSGYDSGVIHIFDAKTHDLKWRHTLDNMDWMGVRSVKIGDVDNDGNTEFVVATANIFDGIIQVYDGKTYALKRQSAGYSDNYFTVLAVGDVDGDGKTEIVAGQGRAGSGATGVYLVVFDGATMIEKWKSVDLGVYLGEVYDIKLADLDNDGHVEIIASVAGNRVYVFDGVTHQMKWAAALPAYAIAISDVDGDGKKEILVGESNGIIEVYDGTTFALKGSRTLGVGDITGLFLDDINLDGINEWMVSDSSTFYIYSGKTKDLLWKKDNLMGAAEYNHIVSRDIDNNGWKEIIFGTNHALYQFEVATYTPHEMYNITGTVTNCGSPLIGATVTLSGSKTGTAITDISGNYIFTGLPIGSYKVTPAKTGIPSFSPLNRTVIVNGTEVIVTDQSFITTATCPPGSFSISGNVMTMGGDRSSPLAGGVTITLSGTRAGTTITDASGNYIFTGLPIGSYKVAPAKTGITSFSPAERTVTIQGANRTNQNFTVK
jgi:hypothetical protein